MSGLIVDKDTGKDDTIEIMDNCMDESIAMVQVMIQSDLPGWNLETQGWYLHGLKKRLEQLKDLTNHYHHLTNTPEAS